MSPDYLRQLADLADPDELWKGPILDYLELPEEKRRQLDMGLALRRHASHIETLLDLLEKKRSLLITPLSSNRTAVRSTRTPADHAALRGKATKLN